MRLFKYNVFFTRSETVFVIDDKVQRPPANVQRETESANYNVFGRRIIHKSVYYLN